MTAYQKCKLEKAWMSNTATTDSEPEPAMPTHCVGCGYNLHGLDESGECPECGKPLKPPPIWIADPLWFERQLVALKLLVLAQFLALAHWIMPFVTRLLPDGFFRANPTFATAKQIGLMFLSWTGFGLVVAVGWLLMRRNPNASPVSPENRWRKLAFPLGCACLAVNLGTILFSIAVTCCQIMGLSLQDLMLSAGYKVYIYTMGGISISAMIASGIWFAVVFYRAADSAKIGPQGREKLTRHCVVVGLALSLITGSTAALSFALCTTLIMFHFSGCLGNGRVLRFIRWLFMFHVAGAWLLGVVGLLVLFELVSGLGYLLPCLKGVTFLATALAVLGIHLRARVLQCESAASA
jgi:hypothetical protein